MIGPHGPRIMRESDEPLDDRELPDAADMDDEESVDDTSTAPCPACGAMIYEDALRCPVCGSYVERDAGAMTRSRRWWWAALMVLIVGALIVAMALW